jgi:hypothetical protein
MDEDLRRELKMDLFENRLKHQEENDAYWESVADVMERFMDRHFIEGD